MEPSKTYHLYTHANGFENLFRTNENYRYFLERYQHFIPSIADTLAYCLMPNHLHFLVRIKGEKEIRAAYPQSSKAYKPTQTNQSSTNQSSKVYKPTQTNQSSTNQSSKVYTPTQTNQSSTNQSSKVYTPTQTNQSSTNQSSKVYKPTQTNQSSTNQSSKVYKPTQTNLGGLDEVEKRISQQFSNLFNAYTKAFNKMYNRRGSLFIPNFKREEITSNEYFTSAICYIHRNPVHHGFVKTFTDWRWSSYQQILNETTTFVIRQQVLDWFGNAEEFKKIHQQSIIAFDGI
jgi:REP element-mobilizing transposase RayT